MKPSVPEVDPDIAALSPFTIGATIGLNYTVGEAGLGKLESKIRDRASEEASGKVSKLSAYYSPIPFPTLFYEYRCETCRFYTEDGDDSGECGVVGKAGDPMGGESVHPDAWCALWVPEQGQEPFDWIRDRLEP